MRAFPWQGAFGGKNMLQVVETRGCFTKLPADCSLSTSSLQSAQVIPHSSRLASLERSALANLLLRPVLLCFLEL